MSVTATTMPSSITANSSKDKSPKSKTLPKKIVILKIPSSKLKQFEAPRSRPVTSSPAPTLTTKDTPKIKALPSQDQKSDMVSVSGSPQDDAASQKPSTGSKQNTPMPSEAAPKLKAKPGPKKKPRLEDGTIDHSTKPTTNNANPRLGPKANTGFINANLRALDRTGTPCRKWQRKGFAVKSFTGQIWEIPSWKGGDKSLRGNSEPGSSQDISMPDSSERKQSEGDTARESHAGDLRDKMDTTAIPSSPPQVPVAPFPIAT